MNLRHLFYNRKSTIACQGDMAVMDELHSYKLGYKGRHQYHRRRRYEYRQMIGSGLIRFTGIECKYAEFETFLNLPAVIIHRAASAVQQIRLRLMHCGM